MSRPRRIPARGDVVASVLSELLGLSLADFEARQPALRERGFPEPEPTTGLYCIEAVDRWRPRRDPHLFPELRITPTAAHGDTVFAERLGRFDENSYAPASTNRFEGSSIAHATAAQSHHWLDERDMKADRQKPFVVLRMSLAADIAKRAA
jgi:hypothetical protein